MESLQYFYLMPTFWTIQHIDKWKEFQHTRVLKANATYIEPYYHFPYQWMIQQMHKRLPTAPLATSYPIWAWYKYDYNTYRPDLRRIGHLPKGTKGVLIEFEEEIDKVLLTDFMNWHLVLNSQKEKKSFTNIIIKTSQQQRIAR